MQYLSLSIDDALTSPNYVARALAMLDRRFGRRRLRVWEPTAEQHKLVVRMYRLRCEAEGLKDPTASSSIAR
jgi:hypothetical protein